MLHLVDVSPERFLICKFFFLAIYLLKRWGHASCRAACNLNLGAARLCAGVALSFPCGAPWELAAGVSNRRSALRQLRPAPTARFDACLPYWYSRCRQPSDSCDWWKIPCFCASLRP